MNNVNLDKTNIVGFPERNMKRTLPWKIFLYPSLIIGMMVVPPAFETVNYNRGSDILNTVIFLVYVGVGIYFLNRTLNHNQSLLNEYSSKVAEYLKTHYAITVVDTPVWGNTRAILSSGLQDAITRDGEEIRVKYRISDDKTEIEVLNERDKLLPKLY